MSDIKMPEYRSGGQNGVLAMASQMSRNNVAEKISKNRLAQQNDQFKAGENRIKLLAENRLKQDNNQFRTKQASAKLARAQRENQFQARQAYLEASKQQRADQFQIRQDRVRSIAEDRIAKKEAKVNKKKTKRKVSPTKNLKQLVQKHNDVVLGYNLDEDLIDLKYTDLEDNAVQNRIWKLEGDDRYTPDPRDAGGLSDQEFVDVLNVAEEVEGNAPKQTPSKLDKMSDDKFTKILDAQI